MLAWQSPLRTSVEFTGRSVESQNRSFLAEDTVGVEEVAGRLGRILPVVSHLGQCPMHPKHELQYDEPSMCVNFIFPSTGTPFKSSSGYTTESPGLRSPTSR